MTRHAAMAMGPEVHSLTGAYACDALSPAERVAFEEHLAACSTCAQEVVELRETVARLAVAAAERPPVRLKAAVDTRISTTRQVWPHVVSIAARRDRRRRRALTDWLGWGASTAMMGVVAVLGVHAADQARRVEQANRQNSAVSALLAAPDARSTAASVRTGGQAMVLASRSRDEVDVTISGLTAASPGKAYQLWMIGPGGFRSAGLLPTTARGTAGTVIAHGLGDARVIGLTLEPATGSVQPTSTPILLLPMPV